MLIAIKIGYFLSVHFFGVHHLLAGVYLWYQFKLLALWLAYC
jgi:hypothetical protein